MVGYKGVIDLKLIIGAVVVIVIIGAGVALLTGGHGNASTSSKSTAGSTSSVGSSPITTSESGLPARSPSNKQPCNACLTFAQYEQMIGSGGTYNVTNQSAGISIVKYSNQVSPGSYKNISAWWQSDYYLYNVSNMGEVNGTPLTGTEPVEEWIYLFNSSSALQSWYSHNVNKSLNNTPSSTNPPGMSNEVNKVYGGFTYSYFPTKEIGFDGNYTPAATVIYGYQDNYSVFFFDGGRAIPASQIVPAIASDLNRTVNSKS